MAALIAVMPLNAWGDAPGGGPQGKRGAAPGGAPGSGSVNSVYTADVGISKADDLTDGVYVSETSDENALLINTGESVSLTELSVSKTGDSAGGDNCSFYGINAAVLAMGGANVSIVGGTIISDANGVFSYGGNGGQNGASGDGTAVSITGTTIRTTGDNSGGIMTTGGGKTYAYDLTIDTSGRSSVAIRTDRGSGTVEVDGGSYTTNGLGSPVIYSTADVSVRNAALTSNLSEGVCIEGKNSVTLTDCDLMADNAQHNGHAKFLDSIMIYQSMSGDADSGTSAFTMTGGSLISKSGHVFHVTNTHAVITLNNVTVENQDSGNIFLSVCADGWDESSNIAELLCCNQTIEGSVLVGSDSYLTLTLNDASRFSGCISGEIADSSGESVSTKEGSVSVILDESSVWELSADSYITEFSGNAAQVISNGYMLYVNGTALSGIK